MNLQRFFSDEQKNLCRFIYWYILPWVAQWRNPRLLKEKSYRIYLSVVRVFDAFSLLSPH